MEEPVFRDVSESDAERLLEIYSWYVENTVITFETKVPEIGEFRERIRRTEEKYPYIAAVAEGRIVGYACAGPFVGKDAYSRAAETTIYLDHERRHQGIGKRLYGVLEELLRRMHILNLNACIGYPKTEDEYLTRNSAEFHAHLGYRMVGEFHDCGYKFGRWYDMVWMEKMIGGHPAYPEPVLNYREAREQIAAGLLCAEDLLKDGRCGQ